MRWSTASACEAQIAAVQGPDRCAGMVLTNAIAYDSWPIPSVKALQAVLDLLASLPDTAFNAGRPSTSEVEEVPSQVLEPGVDRNGHDGVSSTEFFGERYGSRHVEAARCSREQSLFGGQAGSHATTVGLGNGPDLVVAIGRQQGRNESQADPLHMVAPGFPT